MVYISFGAMLTDISRDDLTELYRIVMKKHGMNEPEDEFEKVLWEYLKNMFEEPLSTYSIWSLPAMLDKKLQGGKPDEDCYKLLKMMEKKAEHPQEAYHEDNQRNLKFTSEDQVRGGLLGIIVNRLKSGSYRIKSGRHS
ncbi:hypothetical protein Tco_1532010 [Tanacetum coccineum]